MPATELLTLRDLLRWSISQFNAADLSFGHGSDNAWDEATYLLLHTLNLPLDTLEPFLDARLLSSEREKCVKIIKERIQTRKPAAYLTHEAWLQGLKFYVDERVIIPRSPIAELLKDGLNPWIDNPESISNVLDLCTGSGCLAILAAYVFAYADIDAIDISSDALAVAEKNVSLHQMADRITLIQNDLLNLSDTDIHAPNSAVNQISPNIKRLNPNKKYDLIICNPPYVSQPSMDILPKEYKYEPHNALAGGADGMDLVKQILQNAPMFLAKDGLLVLEIGHEKDNFESAFPQLDPIWLSTENANDQILLLNRSQLKA